MANYLGFFENEEPKARQPKERKQKNASEPIEAKGIIISSQKVKVDDYKPVLRWVTLKPNGELGRAYTEEGLKEAEEDSGSAFDWRVAAGIPYSDDNFELVGPELTVSMLNGLGRTDLFSKVYDLDKIKKPESETASTSSTPVPPAPADPSAPGSKIGMEKRMALELWLKTTRALNPSEQTEEERLLSVFNKQFGLDDDPNADLRNMSDNELMAAAALCFTRQYTGKQVEQIMAAEEGQQSAQTSAPVAPQSVVSGQPAAQPATGQNQTAGTRLVFHNRATGQYLDYMTCEVVSVGQDLGTKKLFEIGTGAPIKVVNSTQPSQPATVPVGSPVAGPQGGTAGFATSAPAADASLEELLKRPDMQKYLLEYGQKCSYTAVQAERKRRKENKQRKRNQGSGNGSNGGQQPGNGNA